MTVFREYPIIPGVHYSEKPLDKLNTQLDRMAKTINGAMQGRTNNRGEITLGSGTYTVVLDALVTATSTPLLAATSSKARTTQWHVSSRTAQTSFRIAHAAGSSGATFEYVLVG